MPRRFSQSSEQFDQYEEQSSSLKTNFLDKQARENAAPASKSFPVMVLMIIVGLGVAAGLITLAMYAMSYPKVTAAHNVQMQLTNPKLENGSAFVDVQVTNDNPSPVKSMSVHYTITGASGATISEGTIPIDRTIAAGEKALVPHVRLGAITEPPKSLHADVVEAVCQ